MGCGCGAVGSTHTGLRLRQLTLAWHSVGAPATTATGHTIGHCWGTGLQGKRVGARAGAQAGRGGAGGAQAGTGGLHPRKHKHTGETANTPPGEPPPMHAPTRPPGPAHTRPHTQAHEGGWGQGRCDHGRSDRAAEVGHMDTRHTSPGRVICMTQARQRRAGCPQRGRGRGPLPSGSPPSPRTHCTQGAMEDGCDGCVGPSPSPHAQRGRTHHPWDGHWHKEL